MKYIIIICKSTGGAGYVLSISKLVQGNGVAPTQINHNGVVMGMDLTMGYVYNMLFDAMPICSNMQEAGVRCFLFDQDGYLIVHNSQFKPSLDVKVVDLHLTHVEHLAMNLMLNDPTLGTYILRKIRNISVTKVI